MNSKFILFLLISFTIVLNKDQFEFYYRDYIESFGYKLEEHETITEDGYELTIWHIFKNSSTNTNKVIYLQPGFVCTSWVFFQLGENSLPFMLIDQGYDVWIGNNRGTIFSWGHTSKDPDDLNGDYWDFSMDENVFYDLPAQINYVKEVSGAKKVHYIGHSQGTTLFYMLYMHNPKYVESSINKFVSLGSVPNIAYATFMPIQYLDKLYRLIEMTRPITKAIVFGVRERKMFSEVCRRTPNLCEKTFEMASSLIPTKRINYETLYPFLYYYPGGTNSNTMLHWSQIHQQKKLVYFNPDFNKEKDAIPYDINVIKAWKIPAFIQRSDCDTFSSYEDVTELYDIIEDKSYIKLVDTKLYGHTDDLAAESAINDVYIPIINFLK